MPIGPFQGGDISAIAAFGATLYVGTSYISPGPPAGPPTGTVSEVPTRGGTVQQLVAPGYVQSAFAFDPSRFYYARSTVAPLPSGPGYNIQWPGLVSWDLATQAPLDLPVPPGQAPATLGIPPPQVPLCFAASSARQGLFWLGGVPVPPPVISPVQATTLYFWDPQSDTNSALATGESLSGVAADGMAVYWTDSHFSASSGLGPRIDVYSAPLDGGPSSKLASALQVTATTGNSAGNLASTGLIGLSNTGVVFANSLVSIEVVDKAGGLVRPVLTDNNIWFVWVDENDLYWVDSPSPGTVLRMPITGGPSEVVWNSPAPGNVTAVAFDACNIYIGMAGIPQVYVRTK